MATCTERVQASYDDRMVDLRLLWAAWCDGQEEVEDLGSIFEYGLCFDWVEPSTFEDQPEGYYRYQLSWGGPSDEFRFYPQYWCIEYWFLDWFDGAKLTPSKDDQNLLLEIYNWFAELGMCDEH